MMQEILQNERNSQFNHHSGRSRYNESRTIDVDKIIVPPIPMKGGMKASNFNKTSHNRNNRWIEETAAMEHFDRGSQ